MFITLIKHELLNFVVHCRTIIANKTINCKTKVLLNNTIINCRFACVKNEKCCNQNVQTIYMPWKDWSYIFVISISCIK